MVIGRCLRIKLDKQKKTDGGKDCKSFRSHLKNPVYVILTKVRIYWHLGI